MPATPVLNAILLAVKALTLHSPETISWLAWGVIIVIAACCLFMSAFVSGSEIAYFGITRREAEELEESDDPRDRTVTGMLRDPELLLATILITNNLVNITLVVLLNYAINEVVTFNSTVVNFLVQTVFMTFLLLLFGEIFPKLVARGRQLRWVRMSSFGVRFLCRIFGPLARTMVKSTVIVNKIVTKKKENISTGELEKALEISDVKEGKDKEMLEGILRFGDTTASEVMTPRTSITGLEIHMSFAEVMKTVIDSGFSRLPVYETNQDDIVGVLYARDLLPYVETPADSDFDWKSLLRKPYFVPESRMIDDLLEDFRKLKIHLAIVVDEFGGTQGLVTLEDVLEEIVGDIDDEYDEPDHTYRRLPNDTYVFEGRTLLTDFFRVTDLNADDYEDVTEDAETLAGMLLAIKGDFPANKEPLVYGRCRFLVLDVSDHRINEVRVKVMPDVQHE